MGNSEKESLENRIEPEIIVRREAQLEVQEAFRYYQEKAKVWVSSLCVLWTRRCIQPNEILSHTKKSIKKRGVFYFVNFLTRFSL